MKVIIYDSTENLVENLYQVNEDLKKQYKIKRIKFALNSNQRNELLEIASKKTIHQLMIKTQLETGLRVNELINMSIKQINFDQNLILIQSRSGDKYIKAFRVKTPCSNRLVPISNELKKELRLYIGDRKNGYVFLSQKKSRFLKNSVSRFINMYAKKCKSIGKNIGSHVMRRTYASYMIHQKIEIGVLSKILGHATIKTTMGYLFEIVNEEEDYKIVRKNIKKMNRKINIKEKN